MCVYDHMYECMYEFLCVMCDDIGPFQSEIISLSQEIQPYDVGFRRVVHYLAWPFSFPQAWYRHYQIMSSGRVLMQMCVRVYIVYFYAMYKYKAPIKWLFILGRQQCNASPFVVAEVYSFFCVVFTFTGNGAQTMEDIGFFPHLHSVIDFT